MNGKALFLDRDGVINVDSGYVYKISDFQFIDGIFDFCRAARNKSYLIFVVTNQAGIGRGLYSIEKFELLTSWMCKKFLAEEIIINKVYFSPYHPVYGLGRYKKDDFSRKPKPGMIFQAADEFKLNLSSSVLVGDKITDIQAGISSGVGRNILLAASNNVPDEVSCIRVSSLQHAREYL